MPFVFGIVGVLLIVSGVRGQSSNLFALVKSDFSGTPNYFNWMIAIFLVGAFGYVKELSTISRMFMFIVLASLLYKNKQVFSDLQTQDTAQPSSSTTSPTIPQTASGSSQPSGDGLPALPTLNELDDNIITSGGF